MSINIIIVNWNSGDLLHKCIQHLLMQTRLPERIIVVDNNSSDHSLEIGIASDRISILKLKTNIGFAGANNHALSKCDSTFVALINPDAFAEPHWIENMLRAAEKYPTTAAFGSRQLSYDNKNTIDGIGDCYHLTGLVWRHRHGQHQTPGDIEEREIFSPCAAAAMYRRDAIRSIGGFDEMYFCYSEDIDLGFRLRLMGYSAKYVPDAVVYHAGSATTGGRHSDFTVYYGHRNLVWTFFKNMPGSLLWLLLPIHLILNIVTIFYFLNRGQGGVILRSKMDAIRGLPEVMKKRTNIQRNRSVGAKTIWDALDKNLVPNKKGSDT